MKSPSARRPVFLDSTGQRRRAIRRAGVFLAVPIVGYLILMSSSLLGGPRLDTPLIPLPEAATGAKQRPQVTPGPAAIQTTDPSSTPSSTPDEPTGTPTPGQTITPPATPTPSGLPTVMPTTPVIAPTTHTTGSPTAPPGQVTATPTTNGNKPVIPPGQTKTPPKP